MYLDPMKFRLLAFLPAPTLRGHRRCFRRKRIMQHCVIGLLWQRCRNRLMMMRRGIYSERPSLVGLHGTKQNLGRFWIPTTMHFEPCSGPRSCLHAIGDSITGTARRIPFGLVCERVCCLI